MRNDDPAAAADDAFDLMMGRPPFVLTFYPFVLTSKKTLVQKDKCVYDAISSLSVRFRPPNIHFRKRLIKSFRLIIIGESESSYTYIFTRQLSITKYIV